MTNAEAWERFERWFRTDGHWVYRSRAHAIDTWMTRGINGLPDFPRDAARMAEIRASFGDTLDYWRRSWGDSRKQATQMLAVAVSQYPWLANETPRDTLDAIEAWLATTPRQIAQAVIR